MAQASASKILRVAIIQGGKIIEERHLKKRENVTIGQEARNTFVVPASSLPATFPIFEFKNGQYALVFTEQMDGTVRLGAANVDFASLRSQNLAKKRGHLWVLPLTDQAKGKVSLGEVTLLFQFVNPPPEPVKPELPPAVKGSFLQSMDQVFFLVLAVSLVVHFSGATFIACQPMPEERELSLDELPDRFAKVMMPLKVDKPPPEEKKQGAGDEKKADEGKKEDTAKKAEPKGPGDAAAKKAAIAAKVASKGLLKILGSSSGGGAGAFEDVLGSGTGSGDIANALAGAGGVGVATAEALGTAGAKGGGAGSAASIGELGTSGGGNVNLGSKGDAKIAGRVIESTPDVESSSVDRNAVAKYIRERLAAIRGCYERELKRNPTLKGKVVVRFSITPSGRAAEVEIEENSLGNDAVASCIRALIRVWSFPFKPESDVQVSYPFVFTPAS